MGKLKTGEFRCNVVTVTCPACGQPFPAPSGYTTRQTRDNHWEPDQHKFCVNASCGEKFRMPPVLKELD